MRKPKLTMAEQLAGGSDKLAELKLKAIKMRSSAMTHYMDQLLKLVKSILPDGTTSQWAILVNSIK
jgi:hypothetical protein